jgi:hypothetical protein
MTWGRYEEMTERLSRAGTEHPAAGETQKSRRSRPSAGNHRDGSEAGLRGREAKANA